MVISIFKGWFLGPLRTHTLPTNLTVSQQRKNMETTFQLVNKLLSPMVYWPVWESWNSKFMVTKMQKSPSDNDRETLALKMKKLRAAMYIFHRSSSSSWNDSFKPAISTGFWASASRWVKSKLPLLFSYSQPGYSLLCQLRWPKGKETQHLTHGTTTNNIWVCDFKLLNLRIICYTARASWQFSFCGVINIFPCSFSFSLNSSCLAHLMF